MFRSLIKVFGLAIALAAPLPALAQTPFTLAGETIRFVLAQAAGGLTDTEVRLLARYLPLYLAGAPTIVVQNLPGASGLRALEYIRQLDPVAEPTIAMLPSATAFRSRAGQLDDVFDARTTNWIGSFAASTMICLASTATGVTSVADMPGRPLKFGSLAAGSISAAFQGMFNDLFGFDIETVAGYDSIGTIALAVQRGELDGVCSPYSSYPAILGPMVDAGTLVPLLYIDTVRRADLDIPWLLDLPMSAEDRAFVEAAVNSTSIARPFMMPVGTPPALVDAMRTAFLAAIADPAFVAEATQLGIDVRPRTGDEIGAAVEALYEMPEGLVVEINALFFAE